MKAFPIGALILALHFCVPQAAAESLPTGEGYVARQESLRTFFEALSAALGKPIITSKSAGRRTVTGNFSLAAPDKTLERITRQMGLIRYDDGQSVYIYEAAESKSAVISLNTITVAKLESFLRRSGLEDKRFPLRNDGARTLYVSGPPIYVDLVMQAAHYMDTQSADLQLGQQRIGVIQLRNTFVGDRQYEMRDEKVIVPGMAKVIAELLSDEQRGVDSRIQQPSRLAPGLPDIALEEFSSSPTGLDSPQAMARDIAAGNIRIVAYPDTNSLLVKGLPEQVLFIENLVAVLDEAKRHVELSLWIVDMQKDDLNQLGVNWQGSLRLGNQLVASLNGGSVSTLDGTSFIAAVSALENADRARVVSRPVVLTQENVPAIFDNNRTFYAPLIGERTVELQHVTYGTLVSVLPRISASAEIEMVLNIEDGSEIENPRETADDSTPILPTVGRTRISTVARVPLGKSLLVGGFTRDENSSQSKRIPVLGSIPYLGRLFSYRQTRLANTVRVFLIQPKQIDTPLLVSAQTLVQDFLGERQLSEAEKSIYRSLVR
jgi:type III secretion system YscC/HrcC family outer membrane pore protein